MPLREGRNPLLSTQAAFWPASACQAIKSKAAWGFLAVLEIAVIMLVVAQRRPFLSPGAMGGRGMTPSVSRILVVGAAKPARSQVPLLYIAALPLWKRVMASGYAV